MAPTARVVPGKFAARGQDYRADLGAFINEGYALGATPEQMDRVATALRGYETRMADYIDGAKAAKAAQPAK